MYFQIKKMELFPDADNADTDHLEKRKSAVPALCNANSWTNN